jgi:hypothetical protein
MAIDQFYREAYGAAGDAFEWGQGVYKEQRRNLRYSQFRKDVYEQQLGTREQIRGQYAGTYSLGETPSHQWFEQQGYGHDAYQDDAGRESLWRGLYGDKVNQANQLMRQAGDAFDAGDPERAEALKAEADALFAGAPRAQMRWEPGPHTQFGEQTIEFEGEGIQLNPNVIPQMATPSASIMGNLIYRGQQYMQGPGTPESQRLISSIRDPAIAEANLSEERGMRASAQGERASARARRDIGLSRGGVRSPVAEAAIAGIDARTAAGQRAEIAATHGLARAQIEGQTMQFFETMAPQFAQNAVAAGQAWIDGRAYVNETYLTLSTSLAQSAMQLSGQMASAMAGLSASAYDTAMTARQMEKQRAEESSTDWVSLAVGAVGLVAGAFTGGAGFALAGAALGAAAGASTAGTALF